VESHTPQRAGAAPGGGGGMKARIFRMALALANLGILVAAAGAGNKW
jgi:hypothetical protein